MAHQNIFIDTTIATFIVATYHDNTILHGWAILRWVVKGIIHGKNTLICKWYLSLDFTHWRIRCPATKSIDKNQLCILRAECHCVLQLFIRENIVKFIIGINSLLFNDGMLSRETILCSLFLPLLIMLFNYSVMNESSFWRSRDCPGRLDVWEEL